MSGTRYRCSKCKKWVDEKKFDVDDGMCNKCLGIVDTEEIESK